jgi:hypothetical protein
LKRDGFGDTRRGRTKRMAFKSAGGTISSIFYVKQISANSEICPKTMFTGKRKKTTDGEGTSKDSKMVDG